LTGAVFRYLPGRRRGARAGLGPKGRSGTQEQDLTATVEYVGGGVLPGRPWVSAIWDPGRGAWRRRKRQPEGSGTGHLVNSAVINLPADGELGEEVWDTTMALNLEAPYLLGRRFRPRHGRAGFRPDQHITSKQSRPGVPVRARLRLSNGALESRPARRPRRGRLTRQPATPVPVS